MSGFPRRSARLSHLAQQQSQGQNLTSASMPSFHSFSQTTSASTTSHPSPTNDGSQPPPPPAPTPFGSQPALQVHSYLMPQMPNGHAPLPSPSTADMEPFFGRSHSQPNAYMSQQSQSQHQPQQGFGGQQYHNHQQQQHQGLYSHHHNSMSQSQHQNIQVSNPGQLPPDFLAEAAKRAQMACLMRDLGDVSL